MHSGYRDIDWLRNNYEMIHYFGLGFIQLKLDRWVRMHFYTPELPSIIGEEDVHNHRYGFESWVVKGTFTQEIYKVVDGDTHILEKESCKAGVEVDDTGTPCSLVLSSVHRYTQGSVYSIGHDVFHKVTGTDCITWVKRGEYEKDLAEVVRPVGAAKVCPFSKKVEEAKLWEIVASMLKASN